MDTRKEREGGNAYPQESWEKWECHHFPGECFCKPLPGKAAYGVSQAALWAATKRPPPLLYRLGLCHELLFPMIQGEISLLAKSVGSGAKSWVHSSSLKPVGKRSQTGVRNSLCHCLFSCSVARDDASTCLVRLLLGPTEFLCRRLLEGSLFATGTLQSPREHSEFRYYQYYFLPHLSLC